MGKSVLFAFTLLVFYSCTKIQTTDIGNGLIPPVDGVNTFDTSLEVITVNSEDEDPGRVYKGDEHVIGIINNDPLFGTTTAFTFFELKPTYYKFSFPGAKDSLKVDSAVLILSYKGFYGDSGIAQNLSVYEINQFDKLKYDSSYGTRDLIRTTNLLGQRTNIDPKRLDDSLSYGFETASNQIRIPLNANFANRLIKTYDSVGSTGAYVSDSLFRENFAGFAVGPSAGSPGQGLIRISLSDTNTKLALFYNYNTTGGTKRDTAVSYFRFNISGTNTTSGSANIITRQHGPSKSAPYFTASTNSNLVFLQTSPGTYCQVKIPALAGLSNRIIHRANLIMFQVPDIKNIDDYQTAPRYLFLTAYDSAKRNKRNVPNDYIVDPTSGPNVSAFGGFVISRLDPDKQVERIASYDFNLTRYVQGIVTRKDTLFPLRIYAPSNDSILYKQPYPISTFSRSYLSPSAANIIANGRVQLAGGSHPNQAIRMKLRIIYSKL